MPLDSPLPPLEAVILSCPDPMMFTDSSARIELCNNPLARLLGFERSGDLLGATLQEVLAAFERMVPPDEVEDFRRRQEAIVVRMNLEREPSVQDTQDFLLSGPGFEGRHRIRMRTWAIFTTSADQPVGAVSHYAVTALPSDDQARETDAGARLDWS